jgi:ribosomal protein S20
MKLLLKLFIVLLVLPACVLGQDDEEWPSLNYLRSDYKAVSVVAHIRIQQAEITGRIGGYENWFKKGDVSNATISRERRSFSCSLNVNEIGSLLRCAVKFDFVVQQRADTHTPQTTLKRAPVEAVRVLREGVCHNATAARVGSRL